MTLADDSVTGLLRGIRHPSPAARIQAARGFSKLANPSAEAFPLLLSAVDDPEQGVREASVQALGSYGQAALPTLAGFLNHPDKYVRRNAVWAIGKFGHSARFAISSLCNALRDADPRTAAGAAQALGGMGAVAGPAVPALIEAMCGTNVVLCRLASKALSQIGAPALEPLMANLRHHDPFVRAEVALALGWMGPLAREAVSELVQLIETYRPKAATGRPADYRPAGSGGTITPAAPAAGPQSSEESARVNGIRALGRIGSDAASALGLLREIEVLEAEPYRGAASSAIREIEPDGS